MTNKQKKALIRELDSFAPQAKKSTTPKRRKAPKPAKLRVPQGARSGLVSAPQRGISNVLGQRTDIPLKQSFAGSESIGRFNGSVAFTETQFPINPGQAGTFPWLSQEARLWEKYEFDKLEFEFRTTINEFSANAYGRVILGVDYDASDPAPSTRSQAEISRPVTAQAPYFNLRLALRKEDMGEVCRYHYVRPGNLPGSSDIKMYDVGVLNFGTDGNINANEVGELWVHYSGTFKNQILESTTTAPLNYTTSSYSDAVAFTPVTGTYVADPLPTVGQDGLNIVNVGGVLTPPAGNYLVQYQATLSSTLAITGLALALYKTGVQIGSSVVAAQFGAAAVCEEWTGSTSAVISCNGTDTIGARADMTSAGVLTGQGSIVILAV